MLVLKPVEGQDSSVWTVDVRHDFNDQYEEGKRARHEYGSG